MKNSVYSFLEVIVNDNQSYPFPIQDIRKELEHLMLSSEEFEYFIRQAHKKIRDRYGKVYSQVFIYVLEMSFGDLSDTYTREEYTGRILHFIEMLENIRICRIEKNTPDGETISAMK
jgi:virulence-associated protein VapD